MPSKEKHDVVILGGGLAGLTTAKFLAEQGVDFVLLEEHDEFHMKACGEGLGQKIEEYYLSDLYESKKGIEREVQEISIETKYGDAIIHAPLLVINKRDVENEIADQAMKHGADIRMNEKVTRIEKENNFVLQPQNIEAKVLIGADGVFSIVRRYMNIPTPHCAIGIAGITQHIEREKNRCYLQFNNDVVQQGYTWFFPKQETWNIGIGSLTQKHFKESFDEFKTKYQVDTWKGGHGPFSKPFKSRNKMIFLVGDAGAQIRSIVGAGNFTAIVSGKILADTISQFSKKVFSTVDSKDYEKTWNDAIGKILRREYYLACVLKRLMRNDYLLHFSISKLAKMASNYFKSQY